MSLFRTIGLIIALILINDVFFIFAEEQIQRTKRKLVGRVGFMSIDNWEDMPVLCLNAYFVERTNILVWGDGRIAWLDSSFPPNGKYFKSRIPVKDIESAIALLKCKYAEPAPLMRERSKGFSVPFISEFRIFGGINHSSHFISYSWQLSIWNQYKKNRERLNTKDRSLLISAINDFDKPFLGRNNCLLSSYRDHFDIAKRGKYKEPYSDDEKYRYARQFATDAELFLLLENTIKSLVPKNHNASSVEVSSKLIEYFVFCESDCGIEEFFYEAQ